LEGEEKYKPLKRKASDGPRVMLPTGLPEAMSVLRKAVSFKKSCGYAVDFLQINPHKSGFVLLCVR
jgi:hypothetical protein